MDAFRLILQLVEWLLGFALLAREPRLASSASRDGAIDNLSVIVPARNEQDNLPDLLESLGPQQARNFEVIVVDDQSEDATASLAARLGARVISITDLPDDWLGKSWACWTGASAARGDVLVFLDADTRLRPGTLARLQSELSVRGGMVTINPYHRMIRPYERLSSFFQLVSIMGMGSFHILHRWQRPLGAFGPCIACLRRDYTRLGGHKAVHADVLDDISLARLFLANGLPVRCLMGRGDVEYRMYPNGIGQLVEGWSKNQAKGASKMSWPLLVIVVAWIFGCFGAIRMAITGFLDPSLAWQALGIVAYLAYAGQIWWLLRRVGNYGPLAALVFPVHLAFFVLVYFYSLGLLVLRGRASWRGRTVVTADPTPRSERNREREKSEGTD